MSKFPNLIDAGGPGLLLLAWTVATIGILTVAL
jgi:hypothetical protein